MVDGKGSFVRDFIKEIINKVINLLYGDRVLKEITYRRLVEDITTFKPNDSRVKAAVATRETLSNGNIKISVVYMDAENKIIWENSEHEKNSFAIVANKADAELLEMFGNKNVILFD